MHQKQKRPRDVSNAGQKSRELTTPPEPPNIPHYQVITEYIWQTLLLQPQQWSGILLYLLQQPFLIQQLQAMFGQKLLRLAVYLRDGEPLDRGQLQSVTETHRNRYSRSNAMSLRHTEIGIEGQLQSVTETHRNIRPTAVSHRDTQK